MAEMINRKSLLKEIQKVDFVLKDLHLYLDTHPNCKQALEMYDKYERKSEMLKSEYQKIYGPLMPSVNNNLTTWEWIKGPWPWENCQ